MATKRPGKAGSDMTKKEISIADLLNKNIDGEVFKGLDDSTLKDLFLKARETLRVGGFEADGTRDTLVENMQKMKYSILGRLSFQEGDPGFVNSLLVWPLSRGHIKIEGAEGIAATSEETPEDPEETPEAPGDPEDPEETPEDPEDSEAPGDPEDPEETPEETTEETTEEATAETTEASDDSKKGRVKKAVVKIVVGGALGIFGLGGLHHAGKELVYKYAGQNVGEPPAAVQPVDPQLPDGSHFDFTQEQNAAIHDLLVSEGLIKSSTQILGVKEVVCEEDKTTMYFKTVIDGKDGVISMPIAQNYTALEALAYADKNSIETKGFAMTLVETAVANKDENGQVKKFVSVADMPALSDYLAGQTEDSTVGARDIYVSVDKTRNITYSYDHGNLSALAFGDDTVYSFGDVALFKTKKGKHISEAGIIEVANMAAGGDVVPYSGQFDFNEIEISKLIALGVNANAEAATQTTTSASSSVELSR